MLKLTRSFFSNPRVLMNNPAKVSNIVLPKHEAVPIEEITSHFKYRQGESLVKPRPEIKADITPCCPQVNWLGKQFVPTTKTCK